MQGARTGAHTAGGPGGAEPPDMLNGVLELHVAMRSLVINGDPGIRKNALIQLDGESLVCFSVTRQGDWHGPDRVQLWCTVGTEEERESFDKREYVPMHLEVQTVDAGMIDVEREGGELAI